LPQSAIVDSLGFPAIAKAVLTNSLENLFDFQRSRQAQSISVKQFARPSAGFRARNSGSAQTALAPSWIWFSCQTIDGAIFGPELDKKGRSRMHDALMMLFTVIFFAVAFLYVKACQKLR